MCQEEAIGSEAPRMTQDEFWHDKMQVSRASQDLFSAAGQGDVAKAIEALRGMGDPDALNSRGLRALQMAIATAHLGMVTLLVERGADVNAFSRSTAPPLVLCAGLGDIEMLRLLVRANADMHASHPANGDTLWTRAASQGHNRFLRVCVEMCGENTAHHIQRSRDGRHGDGATPLHCAAEQGHLDVVELLISGQADVRAQNRLGESACLLAARNGHTDVVHAVARGVNLVAKGGQHPLHPAAEQGNLQLAWVLFEHRADVNVQDHDGASPLMLASRNGRVDMVRQLVAHAADVHLEDADGRTALSQALDRAEAGCCAALLQAGAHEPPLEQQGWRPPYTDLSARSYARFIRGSRTRG